MGLLPLKTDQYFLKEQQVKNADITVANNITQVVCMIHYTKHLWSMMYFSNCIYILPIPNSANHKNIKLHLNTLCIALLE